MNDQGGIPGDAGESSKKAGTYSTVRQALQRLAILGTGRILARLLLIMAIPLLARFYDATAFGLFGIFNTAAAGLGAVATLCYEQGIVPAKTDSEASELTFLALLVTGLSCFILEIVLILAVPVLGRLGILESMTPLLLLLPAGIAFNAIVHVMLQWANRSHCDRVMSSTSILRAGIMLFIQFGATWFAMGGNGLIIGQIAGSIAAAATLWHFLPRLALENGISSLRQRLLLTARIWSPLPLFSLPKVVLEAGAEILNIALMAELFGAAEVGLYWMALRVVTMPSQLTDEPVTQVFYRGATASLARGDGVVRPMLITMLCLTAVNVPFVCVLFLGGDGIFGQVLGSNWLAAAHYAKIMSVGWVAVQLALPLHIVPILLGRLKLGLIFEFASQAVRVIAILIAYAAGSFTLCLGLLSIQHVIFALTFGLALFWSDAFRTRDAISLRTAT